MAIHSIVHHHQTINIISNIRHKDLETEALYLFTSQPLLSIKNIQKSRLRFLMKTSSISKTITLDIFNRLAFRSFSIDEIAVLKDIYSTPQAGVGLTVALLSKTSTKTLTREEVNVISELLKAPNTLKGFFKTILTEDKEFSTLQISLFKELLKDPQICRSIMSLYLDKISFPILSLAQKQLFKELSSTQQAGAILAKAINIKYATVMPNQLAAESLKDLLSSEEISIGVAREIITKSSFSMLKPLMHTIYKAILASPKAGKGVTKGIISQLAYNTLYHHTNNAFTEILATKQAGEGIAKALIEYTNLYGPLPDTVKLTFDVIITSEETKKGIAIAMENALKSGEVTSEAINYLEKQVS